MTAMPRPEANMARQLLVGWRWFDDGLRASLRDAGFGQITTAQSMVFPYLDAEGTRPADLARRLGMSRQGLQQLVAGLVEQGLVELVADPTSGRSKLVRLTERGKESVKAALECLDGLERHLANNLGQENTAQLRELLATAWPFTPP